MKSLFKRVVCCILILCSVISFCACNPSHTHKYSWYLAKEPTCSKDGVLEGVCECGDKIFEEVKSSGHNFVNGICSQCGQNQSNLQQSVEPGQTIGVNINNVYELFKTFGNNVNFETFMHNMDDIVIQNIKIDLLGVLHFVLVDLHFTADLALPSMKVDFKLNDIGQLKNLLQLKTDEDRVLSCVLADGTNISLGEITSDVNQSSYEKKVRSIFINNENVLGVVYTNDTVMAVAKIADMNTAINGAQLVYEKISGKQEYKVMRGLNLDSTKIEIPATHLGLPITRIEEKAFYENSKITEVVLGENITSIGKMAFRGCEELVIVKFNTVLQEIGSHCFADCTRLQRPVIPTSVVSCGEYAFLNTSCSIYVDVIAKPILWADTWCSANNKVYWKGEWYYINGIPVPLQ